MVGTCWARWTARPAPRAIVAVVGDHGESLGEHGEATHGRSSTTRRCGLPAILPAVDWWARASASRRWYVASMWRADAPRPRRTAGPGRRRGAVAAAAGARGRPGAGRRLRRDAVPGAVHGLGAAATRSATAAGSSSTPPTPSSTASAPIPASCTTWPRPPGAAAGYAQPLAGATAANAARPARAAWTATRRPGWRRWATSARRRRVRPARPRRGAIPRR